MLRKVVLSILGVMTSTVGLAGAMGPQCSSSSVTVPCVEKHWSFALDALYLRPIDGSVRGYANLSSTRLTSTNNNWNWGFHALGAYQFNTGNDATISWLHYHNDATKNNLLGYIEPFVVDPNAYYSLEQNNHFDQVNVTFGQHVDISTVKKIRFYAGLQYARIEEYNTQYFDLAASQYTPASYYNNADYNGIGPVMGIDFSYYVFPQLSVLANAATSVLYGTSRLSTGYVFTSASSVSDPAYASHRTIVPGFEAKLGADYAYTLSQGIAHFEAGYQVVDYYNVFQKTGASSTSILNSDYGLCGPYFGLKFVGNV